MVLTSGLSKGQCEFVNNSTVLSSSLVAAGACAQSPNFTPNPTYLNNYPIVYVRIDNHVFQKDDGTENFQNTPADLGHLQAVFARLNYLYSHLKTPIPFGNLIVDTRIQFVLGNTYFYKNTAVAVGMTPTNGKPEQAHAMILANTALSDMEKFNTLHIIHGIKDLSINKGFGGAASGLGEKDFIFVRDYYGDYMADLYDPNVEYSVNKHGGHLAHEVGHSLGLLHTFGGSTCTDHSLMKSTSNNFMDYMEGPIIYEEESLSECQIGEIHHILKGLGGGWFNIDDCVIKSYCQADALKKINVKNGENDIWTNPRFLNGDLIIKNGGTLTIKCYVSIPTDAKIVVEKGGKLILDGGTISNECNNQWAGIYVEGDRTLPQVPFSNQGYIRIINGGKIEHARTAIRLCGIYPNGTLDYSKTGGVVIANNAIFQDNRRDIEFLEYAGKLYASSFKSPNLSSFSNCQFLTTNAYRSDHVTDITANVTMWGVVQVKFNGCTWHDQRDGTLDPRLNDYLQRRDGLFSMDASYRITDLNASKPLEIPSPAIATTIFKNLRYGIQSIDNPLSGNNYIAGRPSTVQDAKFENCLGGLYYSGVEGALLTRNNFEIESYAVPSFREIEAYGIYLDNCNAYQAEGNRFSSNWALDPNNNYAVGFVTNANGDNNNEIYRNFFDDNALGAESIGWNRHQNVGAKPEDGLKYRCNDFGFDENNIQADNYTDIWATHHQSIPYSIAQTGLPQQGNIFNPAFNLFGVYGPTFHRHFEYLQNPASFLQYFHHDPSSEPRVEPTLQWGVNTYSLPGVFYDPAGCPDKTASGYGIPQSYIDQINTDFVMMKLKRGLVEQYVDGGNTELLQQRIQNVNSGTVTTLIQDLATYSPYLSDAVLAELSNSYSEITHLQIKDILVANPHSARNANVIDILQNRTDNFPANYVTNVTSMSSVLTARDTLKGELYHYSNAYSTGINSALIRALNDSVDGFATIIEPLLLASDRPEHKYRLAALYDSRGQMSSADNVLAAIPSMLHFESSQDPYHADLLALRALLKSWEEANVNMANLDVNQLAQLQNYEQATNGIQYRVYPLLALNHASTYIAPIYMPNMTLPNSSMMGGAQQNTDIDLDNSGEGTIARIVKLNSLKVYPNPAQKILNIQYELNEGTQNASIVIYGLDGKQVSQVSLDNLIGEKQMDISALRNGQYICTIEENGTKLKQLKFAITR